MALNDKFFQQIESLNEGIAILTGQYLAQAEIAKAAGDEVALANALGKVEAYVTVGSVQAMLLDDGELNNLNDLLGMDVITDDIPEAEK